MRTVIELWILNIFLVSQFSDCLVFGGKMKYTMVAIEENFLAQASQYNFMPTIAGEKVYLSNNTKCIILHRNKDCKFSRSS